MAVKITAKKPAAQVSQVTAEPPFDTDEPAPTQAITKNADAVMEITVEQPGEPAQSEQQVMQSQQVLAATPMAEVEVSMSMTRNLGNFESIKFSVAVRMPCEATAEDIEESYASAKGWVEDKVNEMNTEIDSQLG